MSKLSRRDVLKLLGLAGVAGWIGGLERPTARGEALLLQASRPRVVHLHAQNATSWNFSSSSWFGDYVNQNVVNAMFDEGLRRLTETSRTRQHSWAVLMPNYRVGQRIAVKVNFNNYINGSDGNAIGSVIEPVNALIRSLVAYGVSTSDIYVYDLTHAWHDADLPARFTSRCLYSGVNFVRYIGNPTPFSTTDRIHFNVSQGPLLNHDLAIANVLVQATYLINMPIVKVHPFTGTTLGLKNHYGSFSECMTTHEYLPGYNPHPYYTSGYTPLVDINNNPHFRNKTILVVGEGLFGANEDPIGPPRRWRSFGNTAPNSLFFSRDPVAADCVMTDILASETPLSPNPDDWLRLAGQAGLGVYQRGSPWTMPYGSGYSLIEYSRYEV